MGVQTEGISYRYATFFRVSYVLLLLLQLQLLYPRDDEMKVCR